MSTNVYPNPAFASWLFCRLEMTLHPKSLGKQGWLWRRGWDSKPRCGYPYNGFRVLRFSSSRFPLPRCWLVMAGATRCRAVGFAKSLQQRLSVYTPKADQLDKKHCVQPACPLMAPIGHSESTAEANSTLLKPSPSVSGRCRRHS